MGSAKRTCPLCYGQMAMGRRVKVNLGWETGPSSYRTVGRFVIVCRKCAAKLCRKAHVEVPEDIDLED